MAQVQRSSYGVPESKLSQLQKPLAGRGAWGCGCGSWPPTSRAVPCSETYLPEMEVLTLLPWPGVSPLTGAGKSVHNLLVQYRYSQVQHPHDEDQEDTGESPQL